MHDKPLLQAVLFDFDGVLVDSNAVKVDAFQALFADYDKPTVARIVAYHIQHGGISRVEKIEHAYRHIINQPLSDEELARLATAYSELVVDKVIAVPWIDGAKEFLDSARGTLPLFVISGTPEKELQYILEQRGMRWYFQQVLGSPIKKPEHIRNILNSYRLTPQNCVFVGDALTDYNAARQTGLHFIGIQGEVTFPAETTILPDCQDLQKAIRHHFRAVDMA